jgi:riboflavin synthase
MFTGIVTELGTVTALDVVDGSARLRIACEKVITDVAIGDSISVNGCCLTVTDLPSVGGFVVDVMGESLDRTGLGGLAPGDPVNLEAALRAHARLGGHLVQGHVDATGTVVEVIDRGEWTVMRFTLPEAIAAYVVEKGSITVDGTSLTVMDVGDDHFGVGLIPHTRAVTVLGAREVGDVVNLEADIVAKYVERLLSRGATTPYQNPTPHRTAAGET